MSFYTVILTWKKVKLFHHFLDCGPGPNEGWWYLGLPAKVDFVTCLHVTKHVIITCLSRATHVTPYFSLF